MTRIWMIKPSLLCRNHLLGQWKELFQLIGSLKAGKSIKGHLDKKQVTTKGINEYAQEVRQEMLKRGYNPKEWTKYECENIGDIDLSYNLLDLCERCSECKKRIIK